MKFFILNIFWLLMFYRISASDTLMINTNNIFVNYKINNDTITFTFTNNTQDTLYLFNTYFDDNYVKSSITHQINKQEKKYIISFLPLLNYMSIKGTDRVIVFNSKRILMYGQNIYSFIKILPNSNIEYCLSIENIFLKQRKNFVRYYDNKKIRSKDLKYLTEKKIEKSYDWVFNFAVYKNINYLYSHLNFSIEAYKQFEDYIVVSAVLSPARLGIHPNAD